MPGLVRSGAAAGQGPVQQRDQRDGVLEGGDLARAVQTRVGGGLHPDAQQHHVPGAGVDEDAVGVQQLVAHTAPTRGLQPGRRLADDRPGGLGVQRALGQQRSERRRGRQRVFDDGERCAGGVDLGVGRAVAVLARVVEHDDVADREQVRILHQVGAAHGVGRFERGLPLHDEQHHVLAGGDRAGAAPYGAVGDSGEGDLPCQRPPGTQCVRLWVRVHGPSFSSSGGGAPVTCFAHATRSPPDRGA